MDVHRISLHLELFPGPCSFGMPVSGINVTGMITTHFTADNLYHRRYLRNRRRYFNDAGNPAWIFIC